MKRVFKIFVALSFLPLFGFAQTMTASGNWDNGANWNASNIGDAISENVTLNNGVDPTIRTGFSYTIGDLNSSNNNDLIIQSGASLTLGASGNPKNLTSSNGTTLSVAGTLIIWGDLIVNNNITWNVTGTVIIKGNVNLGNDAVITIGGTGTVAIVGNFAGGNNTSLNVSSGANVAVGGSVSVGNGSSATGTGTVQVTGTCAGGGSSFCTVGPLPIHLLFFQGKAFGNSVTTSWATSTEINLDYFDVERSINAKDFTSIGKVIGHGNTTLKQEYSLLDEKPFSGKNYYRLKSVDFDGYTEYFKIIAVDFSADKLFEISPNPTDGRSIGFNMNFAPDNKTQIIVYDNFSNIVARYTPSEASQSVEFLNPLKSGMYYAKVLSGEFVKVQRFIVK